MSAQVDTPWALTAQQLDVQLRGRRVLHAVDVAIPRARWTCIVGPNGAGKSTLLRALAGLCRADGLIQLLGRPLRAWSRRERAQTLAWLGQNEYGSDDLTARDVVMLGRLPHRSWLAAPGARDHAAVEQALRATQAWDWRDRPLGQLSGGERQRVLLARLLAVQAPVMLMDEPVASLDPPHQADWLALVRMLVARGHTVVSILHELTLALHADELVIVAEGRIAHHGATADAATHRALERVFDHRVEVLPVRSQWVALPRIDATG
ncbi:MAG: ABC transporter ATP-binding protein [Tepidimonas sp.]|uniref:ABC transporter ATP-binding protein n=1 Tax=Tepidimonas sp. TaxID=2002775 RepID=UPI004054CC91